MCGWSHDDEGVSNCAVEGEGGPNSIPIVGAAMHALNRCFSWSLNPWLGIVCLPRDLHRDRGISADAVLAGAVDAVVFVGEVL